MGSNPVLCITANVAGDAYLSIGYSGPGSGEVQNNLYYHLSAGSNYVWIQVTDNTIHPNVYARLNAGGIHDYTFIAPDPLVGTTTAIADGGLVQQPPITDDDYDSTLIPPQPPGGFLQQDIVVKTSGG